MYKGILGYNSVKCEICENSIFQTGMIDRLDDKFVYFMDFAFVQII